MWYNIPMSLKRVATLGIVWLLYPLSVSAQAGIPCPPNTVCIDTGVSTTVPGILGGIVNVLLLWSGLLTTALFLLGAILMVGSGGSEASLAAGKKIMKSSLIGLALILGSWLLLSTIVYFLAA